MPVVEQRHTRSVAADLEYHATPGSCTGSVCQWCYWQLFFPGPSRWAASIRIGNLNGVSFRAVGVSLKRNSRSCGIGNHEGEHPVCLLSRLLH